MREVILGHDGDSIVYSVPDEVANNLRKYCMDFCDKWIWNDPNAKKYRIVDEDGEICVAYCAEDFIAGYARARGVVQPQQIKTTRSFPP